MDGSQVHSGPNVWFVDRKDGDLLTKTTSDLRCDLRHAPCGLWRQRPRRNPEPEPPVQTSPCRPCNVETVELDLGDWSQELEDRGIINR